MRPWAAGDKMASEQTLVELEAVMEETDRSLVTCLAESGRCEEQWAETRSKSPTWQRHRNKTLALWLRERGRSLLCSSHGIFQWCCKHGKKLRCSVAKGGDRDIKTDAAGCRKNNQVIYTRDLFLSNCKNSRG